MNTTTIIRTDPRPALRDWIDALIGAVDSDNTRPVRCGTSATARTLGQAPEVLRRQAALAAQDLHRVSEKPLARLRSDQVAHRLRVNHHDANVAVARMTVPGGPWPGHFGLEAIVFTALPARFPEFFPAAPRPTSSALSFGRILGASRAYRDGSGAVLFPEQLAVRTRPAAQSFGVVFLDKLTDLFTHRVLPLLEHGVGGEHGPIRRLAFLAHEWGHHCGSGAEQSVIARRRRLVAVISELLADCAAITMLTATRREDAREAVRVLIADRIIREAWLPTPHAQVDAIAARHLLAVLTAGGAAGLREGRLWLDVDRAAELAAAELARVRPVEQRCCVEGSEPAREYLRCRGWSVTDQACHRDLDDPVADTLACHAMA